MVGGEMKMSRPLFCRQAHLTNNKIMRTLYLFFQKALELNDYPTFLLWLTEQDPVLASMVATRQEEFEAVFEKVSVKGRHACAVVICTYVSGHNSNLFAPTKIHRSKAK
jgi:hypothetical protein